MIGRVVGTFWDGFWPNNHGKNNGTLRLSEFSPPGLCHFPENSHTNGWSPYKRLVPMRCSSCCSPNSACTMRFWRFQGLVILCRPRAVPGHAKPIKKPTVFKLFQKNGAGARVLRSTFSFFDECSGYFSCFCLKIAFG